MNYSKSKLKKSTSDQNNLSDYWRERTIFPTGLVPREVKILMNNVKNYDKSFYRKLIKVALGYLQGTSTDEKCEAAFENLCNIHGCKSENDVISLSTAYSGLISLLRAVLKVNLKTIREDILMHDLLELGLPEGFAADICKIVFGPTHSDIMGGIIADNPSLPTMEEFQWQVDVALSNNWSTKILEPCVNMTMKTSDGECHSFEVPTSAFHLLRYSTASVLRQMKALERRK